MKNKLKSKTIAIIGIVVYALSVLLSAEDLQGNPRFPQVLKLISETGMLLFIIMAIVRLWEETRFVALTLLVSTILFFALGVIQEVGILNVIFLLNLTKLVFLTAFCLATVTLFKKKDTKG